MNLLEPTDAIIIRKKDAHEATFDITAMIDLVFMMNIFFLVTTVAAAQLELDLPGMRHCIPTDPEQAVTITVDSADPPAIAIQVGDQDFDSGIIDPDQQKEALQRAVRQGLQAGKKIVLLRAERTVKLREIKRISAAALEGTTDMELRFAVIETDGFE